MPRTLVFTTETQRHRGGRRRCIAAGTYYVTTVEPGEHSIAVLSNENEDRILTHAFHYTEGAVSIRAGLLFFLLLAARPAWAHGDQLLLACSFVLHVLPALALLLVRWHVLWARFLTVAVLAASAVFLWTTLLPRMPMVGMSSVAQWFILLSPAFLACLLAILLRAFVRRPLPESTRG